MYTFLQKKPFAQQRLICFSHAGGNGAEFQRWNALFDSAIDATSYCLPGRGARFGQPPHLHIDDVVAEILVGLEGLLDRPFAIFGHSFGSLLAYEVTMALQEQGKPTPSHLFVSGRRAAHVPLERRNLHDLEDDELMEEVRKMGSASTELFDNKELMELMLPVLRMDFQLHETYVYRERDLLTMPITALGGMHDEATTDETLARWSELTRDKGDVVTYNGGHFFTEEFAPQIVSLIQSRLLG